MKQFKKTILIDLDGVLNQYTGNFNQDFIPEPKEGVDIFLKKLTENYELKLFTTRNRILASKWLIKHDLDRYFTDITNVKELSWLLIDDRCLKFDGDFGILIDKINEFKPWYKNSK
ncbi:MAG: hypothetical protein NC408_02020 [Candidatus Gastranaerophilales bacterium]|nr:hypothetical protein [Candidatus Gastranaerophilales bacterium]MCM1073791.1 hypothetical protein [Bacteroides sp.]